MLIILGNAVKMRRATSQRNSNNINIKTACHEYSAADRRYQTSRSDTADGL
ncbi:MAG: hypothetical protein HUK15_10260 [Bacteroidales bacterium]|nr:hypothetical protein [Bacteroidales bacterium]